MTIVFFQQSTILVSKIFLIWITFVINNFLMKIEQYMNFDFLYFFLSSKLFGRLLPCGFAVFKYSSNLGISAYWSFLDLS